MILEAFSQAILRWLRVPPGASVRKADGPSTSTLSIETNDYIQTIVSITVDDICIGATPLSVTYDTTTPDTIVKHLQGITDEFNSIVKWVAKDLCLRGSSVYTSSVSKKNKLLLFPYIKPVDFYLTDQKEVVVYDREKNKQLQDVIVFINVDKDAISDLDTRNNGKLSSSVKFALTPRPMQLQNADEVIRNLVATENSITKYRAQLSRWPRWANVDIGLSQGDAQKDVTDTISAAINANSSGLAGSTAITEFDDNIPVIPNRKGIGKPEVVDSHVDGNLKDVVDLDYWLSKLNLVMRFPATYMDFSKSLDGTAVSLIRGDIRYAKLCDAIRSLIEDTINSYLASSKKFSRYHPAVSLTQLPSSEDGDVVEVLGNYTDTVTAISDFVFGADDANGQLFRLQMLQDLFYSSTSFPALTKWFDHIREYILSAIKSGDNPEEPDGDGLDEGFDGGDDLSGGLGGGGEMEEIGSEDVIPEGEGEFVEPQSPESE